MTNYVYDFNNSVETSGSDQNALNIASGDTVLVRLLGKLTAAGSSASGIFSTGTGNTLTIGGTVSGGLAGSGIFLKGDSTVTVEQTGTVSGTYGIFLTGSNTVSNHGKIETQNAYGIFSAGSSSEDMLTVDNDGLVSGPILSLSVSRITNKGTIKGSIDLGDHDDLYDGREGTLTNKLVLGGGNDTAYGGSGADTMDGKAGNDSLIGGDGADRLDGDLGDNVLDAGLGNDTLLQNAGSGNDMLIGGDGDDTVEFSGTGATVNLAVATAQATGYGLDTFIGIENLTGTNAMDVFTGNAAANFFDGNAGTDRMAGGAGNDSLNGGADADTLMGGIGNDVVNGEAGKDVLYGDAGGDILQGDADADRLYGGAGQDLLLGGDGKDVFMFDTKPNRKTNIDQVADFNVKDDSIYLDNAIFKALGKKGKLAKPAKLDPKMFVVGNTIHTKDQHIIYNKKDGALFYDADGNGSHAAIQIAILKKGLKVTYKDFFII